MFLEFSLACENLVTIRAIMGSQIVDAGLASGFTHTLIPLVSAKERPRVQSIALGTVTNEHLRTVVWNVMKMKKLRFRKMWVEKSRLLCSQKLCEHGRLSSTPPFFVLW